ncbi:MAG: hypothetical protein IT546_02470, partial [Caulobacteraceae bacterium]|nr:hypothetical protein [Caulobacteraceae bacterium]
LSGEQTVDGVALVGGDRVLVKDQASAIDNGIWNVSTGSWSRAEDFNGVRDAVQGTRVYVVSGAANGNTEWSVTTDDPQIGAAAVVFTQLASLGGLHFGSVADLLAATSLTVATGEVIYAGGMMYEVAALAASDHHLATAGGVKLYEAGPGFTARARLAAAVARGRRWPDGARLTAGGRSFEARTIGAVMRVIETTTPDEEPLPLAEQDIGNPVMTPMLPRTVKCNPAAYKQQPRDAGLAEVLGDLLGRRVGSGTSSASGPVTVTFAKPMAQAPAHVAVTILGSSNPALGALVENRTPAGFDLVIKNGVTPVAVGFTYEAQEPF